MPVPPLKASTTSAIGRPPAWLVAIGPALCVLLLFSAYGGTFPPDVNEAHYLAKARHAWNPSWASGDFFLATRDAHQVFTWTIGILAALFPLPVAAWIGRWIGWAVLAIGWSQLVQTVQFRSATTGRIPPERRAKSASRNSASGNAEDWRSLGWVCLITTISAGLLLAGNHFAEKAGEWFVGGIEAKVLAWGFVFLGLARFVEGRWAWACFWLGLATAFHVLVGGWTIVFCVFAGLLTWRRSDAHESPNHDLRYEYAAHAALVVLSVLFIACGILPGLSLMAGVPHETAPVAATTYVFDRLPHHLVLAQMSPPARIRWSLLVCCWGVTTLWVYRSKCLMPSTLNPFTLLRFHTAVVGSVLLSLVGAGIEYRLTDRPEDAARWLRFYFHRAADVLVPAGLALNLAPQFAGMSRSWTWQILTRNCSCRVVLVGLLGLAGIAAVGSHRAPELLDPRPAAERQALPVEVTDDWRRMCRYLRENTPADLVALTPREQSTFLWDAQRGEVVNWKNVPQDAENLLRWQRRMETVYPRSTFYWGLAGHGRRGLVAVAQQYEADVIVYDRYRGRQSLKLERIWPPEDMVFRYEDGTERPPAYEVYRVPAAVSP